MKICAIICEYNPLHNGHRFQLEEAKRMTDSDAVICLMSGNFVQRGEAAVLEKHVRAKHAIMAGADAVVELPAVFATSSAEIFAKGAVKLLSALSGVQALSFGAENGNAEDFLSAAKALEREPKEVSEEIKSLMKKGESYARARTRAWKIAGFRSPELLHSPNNILGVEYARALLSSGKSMGLFPVKRVGDGHSETELCGEYPSSTALRAALDRGEKISGVPDFVFKDLPESLESRLDALEKFALIKRSAEEIESVLDCREGLENALKKAAGKNSEDIAKTLTSKRYTTSRIRRILLQNLLEISESFIKECLEAPLYLRILAVKKERTELLSVLGKSEFPLLLRTKDEGTLSGTAKKCIEKEHFGDDVFRIVRNLPYCKKEIFI